MATATARNPSPKPQGEVLVQRRLDNGILRLTLNQPERRNALSQAMMAAMQQALDAAAADPAVRVIVIAGDGPAFCAGHDLKELTEARAARDHGRSFFKLLMRQCSSLMLSVVRHPRPVIAEVAGPASAAGCQLVASCDLAIAGHSAKFATPGVDIGLFCSTPMVALSRKVLRKHAMEMLLTGDMVSADRAAEIGLVNRAVPDNELAAEVSRLARQIGSKSLMTLTTGKLAFYEQADMKLADAYAYTTEIMIDNMLKRDAEEGVNAFLEKREPKWRDE